MNWSHGCSWEEKTFTLRIMLQSHTICAESNKALANTRLLIELLSPVLGRLIIIFITVSLGFPERGKTEQITVSNTFKRLLISFNAERIIMHNISFRL